MSDADVLRISKRTTYCEAVYGCTLAQAVSYLKGEFCRVLMEEETYDAGEYQTRLEVLMEMLRRRGQEVSSCQLVRTTAVLGSGDRDAGEPGARGSSDAPQRGPRRGTEGGRWSSAACGRDAPLST